jgi:hypothetical protein
MSAVANVAQNAQQAAVPAAQPSESKWARIAKGALAGFVEGGIPGAIGGAVDPDQAQQVRQAQITARATQIQRNQLAQRSAVQDAQVHAQDNNVQMAQAALNLRHISALANGELPPDFRSELTMAGARAAQRFKENGINPVFQGSQQDAYYHQIARQSINTDNPVGVITLPMADGSFGVFEIPNNDRSYTHAVDLTIGFDAAGKPITKHFEPGSISIARGLALETAAVVDQAKEQSKIAYADAIGLTNKNNASANKANSQAAGGGTATPTIDSLGVNYTPQAGGSKQATKTQATFKKNADSLAQTEQTYQQFANVLGDIDAGKDITGAQSVVTLFNAIGLSAEPLKGKGFRITGNTVEEHTNARGLGESLYQKLLRLQNGDVITPQQIRDYANIATSARENAYLTNINEARGMGIDPGFLLPQGNGRHIDPGTARIFLGAANGNKDNARKAAQAKGWTF